MSNSFRWTQDETEALLDVTLEYKQLYEAEGIDWEQVITKYPDITSRLATYLAEGMAMREGPDKKDFHAIPDLKSVTGKLKQTRHKYRRALSQGRRDGNGTAVAVFYEKCEELWGGYPEPVIVGVGSIKNASEPRPPSVQSVLSSSEDVELTITGLHARGTKNDGLPATYTTATTKIPVPEQIPDHTDTELSPQTYWKIRNVLDECLTKPKRKRALTADEREIDHAKADLEIKRQLLVKLDEMNKRSEAHNKMMLATLNRMTTVLESLVKVHAQQSSQSANK